MTDEIELIAARLIVVKAMRALVAEIDSMLARTEQRLAAETPILVAGSESEREVTIH